MENNNPKVYKVYGMLLEIRETLFLSIQYARSLEEAFNQAKLEFIRLNPPTVDGDNSLFGVKIGIFSIKNLNEMVHENKIYSEKRLQNIALKHKKVEEKIEKQIRKPVEIKRVELKPEEIKNIIMREIVTRKDPEMLEKNKHMFNDNEMQYLKDKLKNKTK